MESTADRIKKAMDLRNMRQADLVEKTKISKGALSSYISGRYTPKQNNIYLIAKALDVNEAWLMGYDVPMERNSDYENRITVKKDILTNINIKKFDEIDNSISDDILRIVNGAKKLSPDKQKLIIELINSIADSSSDDESETMQQEHILPQAAHERTDIEVTDEMRKHDDDIMDDDDFWNK